MGRLETLYIIDKLARLIRLRRSSTLNQIGKKLLKSLIGQEFSIIYAGSNITGPMQHFGYLHSLQDRRNEPFMTILFKRILRPGMIVLDVGAFLGQYTLLAARTTGVTGMVYAFEPSQDSFSFLLKNIKSNALDDCVTAVCKAASDKNSFEDFLEHGPESSLFRPTIGMNKTSVECISIDDILPENVLVNIIKIDIEGAEIKALKGMEKTIGRSNNNLVLFVECNPSALRASGGSANELVRKINELGMSVMVIDEQNLCLTHIEDNIDKVKYVNLYCTSKAVYKINGE